MVLMIGEREYRIFKYSLSFFFFFDVNHFYLFIYLFLDVNHF